MKSVNFLLRSTVYEIFAKNFFITGRSVFMLTLIWRLSIFFRDSDQVANRFDSEKKIGMNLGKVQVVKISKLGLVNALVFSLCTQLDGCKHVSHPSFYQRFFCLKKKNQNKTFSFILYRRESLKLEILLVIE